MTYPFGISEWLSWSGSVALLILSLLFCYQPGCPAYLRSFPAYCFLNVLSDLLAVLSPSHRSLIYLLFTVLELAYFSFFLSTLLRRRRIVLFLWGLDGLFVCFLLRFLWKYRHIPFGMPEVAEVILLLWPAVLCYLNIFSVERNRDLQREPSFWILTGLLIYLALLIPTLFVSQYYELINKPVLAKIFYSANSLVLIVSYSLYAKGLICWKTK